MRVSIRRRETSEKTIPADTKAILNVFAPPPDAFVVPSIDAPSATFTFEETVWNGTRDEHVSHAEPVRIRETAAEAEADLSAVLRLVEAGRIKVTATKLVPTEAGRAAVAAVLSGGDFYPPEDAEPDDYEVAHDIGIRTFAWPLLVQAGGLAERKGAALALTTAGRRALGTPPSDTLRRLFAQWRKTKMFDEFARVDHIKGQGKAKMSAGAVGAMS